LGIMWKEAVTADLQVICH